MWARIMGVSPVHFNGGDGNSIDVFPLRANCNDFWPQYAWQNNDRLSREELARAIHSAEQDIARAIGYYPAPKWIAQELSKVTQHYRRDLWQSGARNVRGARKSVKLKFGRFIQGGRRNVSQIPNPVLVYSHPVDDGFDELVTITAPTALTDVCEIKVYFAGHGGDPEWEIRPVKSKSISLGVVTITLDSWLLFDPDLWEAFPGGVDSSFSAIDISDPGNFVTEVDLYREFNDFSQASAVFMWEPDALALDGFCSTCTGEGCAACSLTTQDGCIHQRGDPDAGIVVPAPGTYDSDSATWAQAAYAVCRDPDSVKLYYFAGLLADRWLAGDTCEALSIFWAQIIAEVATARLTKPPCSCNHIRERYDELREDLARIGRESSTILDQNLLANPFGTRRGEVESWRKISGLVQRRMRGGVL